MKSKWMFGQFVRAAFGVVGILLLIGAIVLAIKTLPRSTATAYPPPDIETPLVEPDKKSTPIPLEPPASLSPIPTLASDEFSFYNRPAKEGVIIETGFSSLRASYLVVNQWFAEFDGKKIYALAGAKVSDPAVGGALPKPWPSILVIEVITADGEIIPDESGNFELAENSGPLRIIDADREEISLVTRDGKRCTFNLKSKTFSGLRSDSPMTRQVSEGAIWETGNVPVFTNEYTFENYWLVENDNKRVYVFAGVANVDSSQGVLVKYSIDLKENQTYGMAYFTPLKGGSNRIVDFIEGKLIIITSGGVEFAFDIVNEQLFTFSHATLEFTPLDAEDLVEPLPFEESKLDPSASPTITSTVTPSITPLPSLTPLPYP